MKDSTAKHIAQRAFASGKPYPDAIAQIRDECECKEMATSEIIALLEASLGQFEKLRRRERTALRTAQ
jgi:glutamate racemase